VLELDAQYLFGAPVAAATTEWSVSRRTHWLRFAGWDEYTFDDDGDRYWYWQERDDYGEFVGDGEGQTGADGKLAIEVQDPETDLRGPQDYIVNATVTDEADQTISVAKVITAHQTDTYLGLHVNEWVQAVDMPFAVNAIAVAPDGARKAAKARLTFTRRVTTCAWQELGYRSYSKCKTEDELAIDRQVEIPATGQLTERIYPKAPGDYVVKLEGTDAKGQPIAASSTIWVIGKGEAFWSGDESARMTLIASKARYQVGDTARLVAQANLVAPIALVTIERDGVIHAEVKHLESAAQGVELEIDDAWAPNVFASVAMVSGRHGEGDRNRPQFKMGVVELAVDASPKRLDVDVQLDDTNVKPGEPVTGKVVVTSNGKPVAAELSLSVADEGVLSLIAYPTPDPMATFYATWGLGVDTVFQDFKLIPTRTVLENISFVPEVLGVPAAHQRRRAFQVLKWVGLQHRMNAYPKDLSGGEQQRVAIARALVNDPALLIADEPTGNLDPDLSLEIMNLLREINAGGTTVLVATHDRELIRLVGRRTITLDQGRVVEVG
jgi:uncharacterized protein YfaS (alpha-2-macroglobulin family)